MTHERSQSRPPGLRSTVEKVAVRASPRTESYVRASPVMPKVPVVFDSRTHYWDTDLVTGQRVLVKKRLPRVVRSTNAPNSASLAALAGRLKSYGGKSPSRWDLRRQIEFTSSRPTAPPNRNWIYNADGTRTHRPRGGRRVQAARLAASERAKTEASGRAVPPRPLY